jgi:predicted DNA-binding protein with PD1-like motif
MRTRVYTLGSSNLLRLPPGEDLLVGLHRICRERGITFGVFMAIGSVRSATLGHLNYECGETCHQVLETGQDLVQCSGNISLQGGSFAIHAYAVLSDSQGQVSAGELLAAEVYVVEVFIQEVKGTPLTREMDPETGLWLWPVA